MKHKKTISGIITLLVVIVSVSFISAVQCSDGIDNDLDGKIDYPQDNGCANLDDGTESLILGYANGCLNKGDKLKNVFGDTNYECKTTLCLTCVLMTEAGNYTTLFSKCNGLPQCGFSGGGIGGNTTLDITPPELTLISPLEGGLYTSKSVLVKFSLDEKADVYYTNTGGGWTKICDNCGPGLAYSNQRNFNEGLNKVQFKAVDIVGNDVLFNVSFFVDSQNPDISKTEPESGFVSSEFYIEFKEENPTSLVLNIGEYPTIFRSQQINLGSCYDISNNKKACDIDVDLSDYDGQEIDYWYVLEDIAGNSDESGHNTISVDETAPVINNPNSFWTQGNGSNQKYIYFNISITEENLDEVVYTYLDKWGKLKEKKICSNLNNGWCYKKESFTDGNYTLNLQVIDEAGNEINKTLSFLIDTKDPVISKTEPKNEFFSSSSGLFYIEFKEENPTSLVLNIGEYPTIFRSQQINLGSCYDISNNKKACDIDVDLSDYDGQEIDYWYVLEDIAGNSDESGHNTISVDETAPVINNPNSFWTQGNGSNQKYIYFNISITEENLDEVVYTYLDKWGKLKEKKICSNLNNGWCYKKESFTDGNYTLNLQVIDEAGNSIGESISFNVA